MFDPEKFYRTDDPALRVIATKATMTAWRHRNVGPAFHRVGRRVLYRGADLLEWIATQRVRTGEAA